LSAPTDNQIYALPANQFSPSPGTTLVEENIFSSLLHPMKLSVVFALLFCLFAAQSTSAQSAPPLWPAVWSQAFFETSGFLSQINTTGYFYYDSTNQAARTDRANGGGDRYCGSVHPFTTTPCTHYVWQGRRYLHFPKLNSCCMCCTNANGCGIVKRDWLVNGTSAGTSVINGTKAVGWEMSGVQKNYWWQTVDTGVPLLLDQQPNDQQYFDPQTFSTRPIGSDVLKPPSICDPSQTCPFYSVCNFVR